MKILVLTSTFPRWKHDTIPPFVFLLSRELRENGVNIVAVAPHYPKAKFFEIIDGIEIYRFPYFFPFSLQRLCYDGGIMANIRKSYLAKIQVPLFLVMEFLFTLYVYLKTSPQLIHAHWAIPQGFVASLIKNILRIPLVTSIHGSDIFIFKKGSLRSLITYTTKSSNIVTLNSSASFNALSSIDIVSKKEIIPMGIDTRRFSPDKKNHALKVELHIDGPFFLAIGRLVELKGFNFIIDAMKDIIQDYLNAKLVIIGDGPERKNLENQAKKLNIQNNVLFLGNLQNSELPKYYATADIFIGPSITTRDGATEAFGIVFIEALSSGTPVISTDVGGIPDIIKDNVTGIVVPQKDSKSIYLAVKKILSDSDLRKRLGQNGLQITADKFSWEKIAKRFINLYNKIIASYEENI